MTLRDLPIGKTATILSVGGEGALRQHFLYIGLIPKGEVTMLKYAPMCDLSTFSARYVNNGRPQNPDLSTIEQSKPHPGLGEGGKYHIKATENPLPDTELLTFALAGNQNCGKTTLFNQLTGSNQHVGNFPGVTVDRKDGMIRGKRSEERRVGKECRSRWSPYE